LDLQILMSAQPSYAKAVKKYGQTFAEAVVANELQLHADSLDCFDEYIKQGLYLGLVENRPPAKEAE